MISRRLQVRSTDLRRGRGGQSFDPLALVFGLALAGAFHGLLGGLLVVATMMGGGASAAAAERTPSTDERPEVEFIEAKLVRLGREFQPREMPNKLRPTRSTGPRRLARTPNKNAERVRRDPDETPTPENAVEDILARLGQSASEQARIAEESEREGDPRGVEEGTETSGNEEQMYRGLLYVFFRRGFTIPSSISETDRAGLRAVVSVRSSGSGVVEGFELRSSGNAEFDQAVRLRMNQAVGAMLPTPPNDELRSQFFGASFPVSFSPPR